MKLCIFLLFVFGCICHGSEIWYETEMSTYLVPPFQNAYRALQNNILDKLSTSDPQSLITNDGTLASLSSALYCAIEKLLQNLDASATASNNIRIKVDSKLLTITNDIAAKEKDIARIDSQRRDTDMKIQAKQSQIRAAEQTVAAAERSVADAQDSLSRAEQEVEDAKLCAGLLGRRKRFLGNVWNSIQNSVLKPIESAVNTAGNAIGSAASAVGGAIVDNVVKPVCSVINVQQIDNARRNVENKKNDLAFSRNQVQTFKNDLNSIQSDLAVFSAQLFNLNFQLNQLKNSLMELPNEKHIILLINQKLTALISHIRKQLSGSASLLDAMTTVLDFESVVQPMNAVYDELLQNQFMRVFGDGKISIEQINQVKINLQALVTLVPTMGTHLESTRCEN